MRRPAALLPILALVLALGSSGTPPTPVPGGRLGSLRLFGPEGTTGAVVVWLGNAPGWSQADEAAARRLAAGGAIVAGVDLPVYLAAIEKEHSRCLYLAGDVEHAARLIERRFDLDRFRSPIVAGVGPGGRLALAMMEQAPPVTLASAAVVDPVADVKTAITICRQPPSNVGVPNEAGAESAIVAFSGRASSGKAAPTLAALSRAGLRPRIEPIPAAATAEDSLAELILRHLAVDRQDVAVTKDLSDLPIIGLPAAPGAPLAIVLSGDGGWRDIDREIAEIFASPGLCRDWLGQPALFLASQRLPRPWRATSSACSPPPTGRAGNRRGLC